MGEITKVESGVPHIMVVNKDITTFEWWDGEFIAELCEGEFDHFTKGKIGPEHFIS